MEKTVNHHQKTYTGSATFDRLCDMLRDCLYDRNSDEGQFVHGRVYAVLPLMRPLQIYALPVSSMLEKKCSSKSILAFHVIRRQAWASARSTRLRRHT